MYTFKSRAKNFTKPCAIEKGLVLKLQAAQIDAVSPAYLAIYCQEKSGRCYKYW